MIVLKALGEMKSDSVLTNLSRVGTYQLMGTIMYLGPEWNENFIHIETVSWLGTEHTI